MAMFADVTAGSVAPTMIKQCEQLRPDLVVYEGMDTGAGVAASVLGIPAAAYAIALETFVYGALHQSTVSYQRGLWLQRDRTPPDETTLLAAALINPAPPSVREVDGIAAPTIPIRSVAYNESSAGVPAWPFRTACTAPGISLSAPCRSARSTYSAERLLRSRRSAWTSR